MRIIKHFNPHFPERETYKCTIRYTTKFGTLDEVNQWRDDQLENEDYYKSLEESNTKATGEFYKKLNYKGD
jgi:hypothetical protein